MDDGYNVDKKKSLLSIPNSTDIVLHCDILSSANSHGSVGRVHAQFVTTFYCHHSSGGVLVD